MIDHIIKLLYQKNYHLLDDSERGVFIREADDDIYMILLDVYRSGLSAKRYIHKKQNLEFKVITKYKKNVNTLFLIVSKDGMFDDELTEFITELTNAWVMAADTGRIYVYENQPGQFDGLREYLEDNLFRIQRGVFQSVSFRLTPFNCVIVLINIMFFIYVIISNGGYYAVYDTDIMLKMGASSYNTFIGGRWYEIITSMFLHFGFSHLFNNMLLLIYAGCELEKRIGGFPYLFLYIGSGIFGNLVSLWHYNNVGEAYVVSAGASGAIFGVIGGLIIFLLINPSDNEDLTPKRLMFMALLTIYYGLSNVGVDNAAHIGGFCFGIFAGFLLSKILHYGKLEIARFMR